MQRHGYGHWAVFIHWLLALLIFFQFLAGWWMMGLPLPSGDFSYRVFPFALHKNVGITLFVLLGVLLFVRFKRLLTSESADAMKPWMHKLAIADHIVLYVLIAACALSGYLSSSYSGWSTKLWWTLELPSWGHHNDRLNAFYSDVHAWSAWSLLAFIALHTGGALYHAFRNDGVIRRMMHL